MDGQSSACHPLQAHLVLESPLPFRLILYWIRLNHQPQKRYNQNVRIRFLIVLLALLTALLLAQESPNKAASNKTASDKTASQSREATNTDEESSSHDTRVDTS